MRHHDALRVLTLAVCPAFGRLQRYPFVERRTVSQSRGRVAAVKLLC